MSTGASRVSGSPSEKTNLSVFGTKNLSYLKSVTSTGKSVFSGYARADLIGGTARLTLMPVPAPIGTPEPIPPLAPPEPILPAPAAPVSPAPAAPSPMPPTPEGPRPSDPDPPAPKPAISQPPPKPATPEPSEPP